MYGMRVSVKSACMLATRPSTAGPTAGPNHVHAVAAMHGLAITEACKLGQLTRNEVCRDIDLAGP